MISIGFQFADGHIDKFGVTQFPDRKRKCLYFERGNVMYPLAYFKNDECANMADEALNLILKIIQKDEVQK